MFHIFYSIPKQRRDTYRFFRFLSILLCNFASSLFGKIPWEFMRLILEDSWVVDVPFVHIIKLEFFAQFTCWSPCQPSHVYSYTISVVICSIHLIHDWSFRFYHHNLYITIIIYSLEFFTSALADGLSLKIERQQVSSTLQDSSQYSGRRQ